MTSDVPRYDELPELGNLGVRHAWDALPGPLGTLAFQDTASVVAGAALVRSGRVVPLNLDPAAFDPPLFGREALTHTVFPYDRNSFEDRIDGFNPQASSQWDGLGHVRAREHGFFGGLTDVDDAREQLGMHHWARRGIAGRGVLLDVVAHRAAAGRPLDPFSEDPITADELAEVADAEGVDVRPGDVLCVRTGWAEAYLRGDPGATATQWAGLSGLESTARWLWDHRVAAVAADNPAVERGPGDPAEGSLHRRLIPALGVALAELLDFAGLAQACAEERRHEFLFVAVPLPRHGAVSSPANAVALL